MFLPLFISLSCQAALAKDNLETVQFSDGSVMIRVGNTLHFPSQPFKSAQLATTKFEVPFEVRNLRLVPSLSIVLVSGARDDLFVNSKGLARKLDLFGRDNVVSCMTTSEGIVSIVYVPLSPLGKSIIHPGQARPPAAVTRVVTCTTQALEEFLRDEKAKLQHEVEVLPMLNVYGVRRIVFIEGTRLFELARNDMKVEGDIRRPVTEIFLAKIVNGQLEVVMSGGETIDGSSPATN